MELCIGLFGSCGGSQWREPFKLAYFNGGIAYFDPQVDDWDPSLAEEEAHHLANDAVIAFAVTRETYAAGSLVECGFSILQAIRLDDRRDFIVMIDSTLDESLDDPIARRESLTARALVIQHLKKLNLTNVYLVDTFEQMLEVSVKLYAMAAERLPLQVYNPQNRQSRF